MKLLRKTNVQEVERTFVNGNEIRIQKSGRRYLGKISTEVFLKKVALSKKRVLKMTNRQLNNRIADPLRINSYNKSDWYLGEVRTNEVGVWKRAGGLPLSWTNGSLKETADKIRDALQKKSTAFKGRARRNITNMLATNVRLLQSEKYLLPIIFKSGTGTLGRRGLKRVMKGDIDDGCMRSIALAVRKSSVHISASRRK